MEFNETLVRDYTPGAIIRLPGGEAVAVFRVPQRGNALVMTETGHVRSVPRTTPVTKAGDHWKLVQAELKRLNADPVLPVVVGAGSVAQLLREGGEGDARNR